VETTTSQSVEAAATEAVETAATSEAPASPVKTTATSEAAASAVETAAAEATTPAVETAPSAKATASTEAPESRCCSEDQGQQHRAEVTCSPHNAPPRRTPPILLLLLSNPGFLIMFLDRAALIKMQQLRGSPAYIRERRTSRRNRVDPNFP
jgi:hypothetical protein